MVRAVYKVMRAAFWNNAAHKKGVVTIMQPKYSLVHLTGIGTSPPEFIGAAAAAGYDCVSLRTISMGMPGEIPHDLTKLELLRETRDALRETGIIFNDTENTRIVEGTDVTAYEPHLAAAAQLGVRHILGNIWTPEFAKLKKGEAVLTEKQQEVVDKALDVSGFVPVSPEETMLGRYGALFGAMQSTDLVGAKMQAQIQKDTQQAHAVVSHGGDSFDINVPVQIYPAQKLDEKEIKGLTDKISKYTIAELDDVFALRGKRSFRR